MEEEKAVAYYDELTRKGGGAARFKQGLGFSSTGNDAVPVKQASSSSSFLSSFVRASSPTTTSNLEKQSQLESIQNKLKRKPSEGKQTQSRVSKNSERDRGDRDRDRERSRRERDYRDHRDRDRGRDHTDRDRDRDGERSRRRRNVSPPRERRDEKRREVEKGRKTKVDFSRLIDGYGRMVCLSVRSFVTLNCDS